MLEGACERHIKGEGRDACMRAHHIAGAVPEGRDAYLRVHVNVTSQERDGTRRGQDACLRAHVNVTSKERDEMHA
jgi:hypothetical protein